MYGNYGDRGDRRGGFEPRRSFAPVKIGEEFDVTIEAVGEKGDGVAKVKGFVLFVPSVKEGQRVKIRVNKVLRKVGFAEVVGEATTASEEPQGEESAEESENFGEEPEEEEPTDETEEENLEDTEDSEDF